MFTVFVLFTTPHEFFKTSEFNIDLDIYSDYRNSHFLVIISTKRFWCIFRLKSAHLLPPAQRHMRNFYRAMQFTAKRGIAIACRLSVCLSVRPSVRLSVTLVDCDHIGWNTSEIISPLVSLGRSLSANPNNMGLLQGKHPEILP